VRHAPRQTPALWALAIALLGAALPSSPVLAQGPPAEGMIAQDARTQVSEHVWVILDGNRSFIPNVGIVVGAKATLIVDTGMGDRNGAIVLAEARKLSDNTEFYLTATHFHPEHDLGANGFPASAKMLRWKGQQIEADEDGATTVERFKSFSPALARLLDGVQFRAPDVLFDDEITVDLGGVHVRLFGIGPNHTRGDTSFFVVEDEVLFTGDTVMPVLPAVSAQNGSLEKWIANLALYESLEPVMVVPAHGKLIDVSYVRRYRAYLSAVQTRTAAAKRDGASVESAVERLAGPLAQEFADLAPANGAAGRINAAIQAAYREAR
jgi:glyoxylase-like metal-dependent hydrolase (beta-lactamase superfamily II)